MLSSIITLAIILIAYSCIKKGKIFTTDGIPMLFLISVASLLIVQSTITIIQLSTNKVNSQIDIGYVSLASDSTNSYFKLSNNEITIYNKIDSVNRVSHVYEPSDCIIDTNASFNYISIHTKKYLPNKWVSEITIPSPKIKRILYMTRNEYKNLCKLDPKFMQTWKIKN